MDQKTIVDGLQKALANGSGTLDDLENLLNRAKQDIAKAKEEQEKEIKVRGLKVAEMANRILEDKTTDDDCAYVINSWMRAKGIPGKGLTGKDLAEIFANDKAASDKIEKDLNRALDELANSVADWAKALGVKYDKPKTQPKKEDPNAVIDDFLKSFGLR